MEASKRTWIGVGGFVTVAGVFAGIYFPSIDRAEKKEIEARQEAIFRNQVEQVMRDFSASQKLIAKLSLDVIELEDEIKNLQDFEGDSNDRFKRNEKVIEDNERLHTQQIQRATRRIEQHKQAKIDREENTNDIKDLFDYTMKLNHRVINLEIECNKKQSTLTKQ